MKKLIIYISLFIITGLFSLEPFESFSQLPPGPPADHGSTGNQGPTDVPIGGGLFIILGLGGVYGGVKYYQNKKKKLTV